MTPDPPFDDLMVRLRGGAAAAAAEVFNRFAERLIALARSRLDRHTRQKVDPEDVVQSVYRSFFRRHVEGRFDVRDWDNLWTLLTVLAVRKCANRVNYFRWACRDVRQEAAADPGPDGSGTQWEASSHEPTPEEEALLGEVIEQLMRDLDPVNREIVVLALQGCTAGEISTQLGRARRTVQRVLEMVKKRLQRLQAEDRKPQGSP